MDRQFLTLCGVLAALTFGGTLLALRPASFSMAQEDPTAIGFLPNCAAAHALGAVAIRRGEPGYRPGLDRDGDGVACEPVPGSGSAAYAGGRQRAVRARLRLGGA